MTGNISPSHYKGGPFECIELSRLLSSDWGQVVQYCYRWKDKNGTEDLRKAAWFAQDAVMHGIPIITDDTCSHEIDYRVCEIRALLTTLAKADWMELEEIWMNLAEGTPQHVLTLLIRKIAEIENEKEKTE